MLNRSRFGFLLGVIAFLIPQFVDPIFAGLSDEAWQTLGLAMLMATWWITECVPIPVTSFLPIALAPFVGVLPMRTVTESYGDPIIFLFLGGFVVSLAIERVGLHERIARTVVAAAGPSPRRQIGGLMFVTAGLSMWISNTATAVMMLPIASSMILKAKADRSYSVGLLLAVAYGASIGGLATLVGTPPNAFLASHLEKAYGYEIGFGRWMIFGVPLSLTLLVFAWLILTWGLSSSGKFEAGSAAVRQGLESMGKLSPGERRVGVVFVATALCWMFRSYLGDATHLDISDTGIAIAAAVTLFLLPLDTWKGERILDWPRMARLPWGVLLLFGGGLALAAMMKASQLDVFIGQSFTELGGASRLGALLVVTATIVFLTEITSNTATAASLVPIVCPIAVAMGDGPATLAIPAAIAASCAFMLPVATPPNAIVFSSGELRVGDMAKAGFWLNLVSIGLLAMAAEWAIPMVFR